MAVHDDRHAGHDRNLTTAQPGGGARVSPVIGCFADSPTRARRAAPPATTARLLAAIAATLLALACAGAATAAATPALTFSAPATFDAGHAPSAVACTSEALCTAVDGEGDALVTDDPASAAPAWSARSIDAAGAPLDALSCPAEAPCVAVDAHGDALVQSAPGAGSWSSTPIDGDVALTGVSCPTASLCVAVDEDGRVLTSDDPAAGAWSAPVTIDSSHHLRGVSCASPSLCVAVDDAGQVLTSADPTGGTGAWHAHRVDFAELRAVSCASSGACVAVDADGEALASQDPAAGPATWSLTPIAEEPLSAISCAASGLCVAVDGAGRALASDDATTATPQWSATGVDGVALTGVSCLPGGLCVAVDADGRALTATAPVPAVTTLAPTQTTSSGAVLAGEVNPEDATLSGCAFEYGTALPYTQSAPCASAPTANGGVQQVTAQLSGLAANTAYHYRLAAASPRGQEAGVDVTFTTAISAQVAIVQPHPSIAGTPAVGQKLTCDPGAGGTGVQLAYAWVRDQIPIAGYTTSAYTVKGQDSGHHLQCQVTATDGGGSATANSAFVTIPMGGVPAAAGETSVGTATFAGDRVSVPVTCSARAGEGCRIALRVNSVARHPLALAGAQARLAAGASRVLSATLVRSARRLLAKLRRVPATVYVTGTVIGVIEAQLAQQALTLTHAGRASARRVSVARWTYAAAPAPSAARAAKLLAATPYMGWDTYFALGGGYSESSILEQASRLISLGLEKRGYRYVWLDVGWWHGTREADGQIAVSPVQWPHGLAWLTRTLHAAGLLVGLYTDAGPNGCGGAGEGSYGHYQQDADTFAAWGFDAVKVDFCGGAEYRLQPQSAYAQFAAALRANSSHRPMLLSICDFLQPEQYGEGRPGLAESAFASYTFGPTVGNSWRTDTDVGTPGDVPFADVLRNLDADAAAPQAAGPGHWNDPDYLAPDQGMSATQFRSQLSMWAMLAAPLMVSDNLTRISAASLQALRNEEVIAVDQDPAGVQGTLVSSAGNGEVWVKPLVGGARAVALLNRGSAPLTISTTATEVGLPAARAYSVRNLWTHAATLSAGAIAAQVPGDGTALLRISTRAEK